MYLIFFLVYVLVFGYLASFILGKFFGFTNNFSKRVLGIFSVFVSLGWFSGAAILFVPLHVWVWVGIFVLNSLFYFFLARWAKKREGVANTVSYNDELGGEWLSGDKSLALFFLVLMSVGFYLLYNSKSGAVLLTPWQTINSTYIIIFLLSTCALGLLIFSKLKTTTILLFVVLQTFLLHSYLPASHTLIYGADGWRHIANEARFQEGKGFLEAKLSPPKDSSVPTVNIAGVGSKIGQLSYSSFWSTNVLLAKIFNQNLIVITKWFLPIVWSLVFPLVLFELVIVLGLSRKKSLFISWLSLLPFAWHAAGAFSLPVNFGLLIWLFLITLILKRINAPRTEQIPILVLVGVGLIFGYALYFILFWFAWFVAEVFIYISSRKEKLLINFRFVPVLIAIGAMALIPIIEFIFGYSSFDRHIYWFDQAKQLVGNISGFYLAQGPRAHDIVFGNIIFNQTPASAFVPTVITYWRWWIVVFAVSFFIISVYGFIKIWQKKQSIFDWLLVIAATCIGGYFITNYFLTGSHILARRLDGVVVLFLLMLFCYGLFGIFRQSVKYYWRVLGLFVFSVAISASYSLGPDTNTVSVNQYQAAQHVWDQEKNNSQKCVLGDTYPLLALEAISAKEVIGGNFPIDANFGQPERVELFAQTSVAINEQLLSRAGQLTQSDHCWFIGSTDNFKKQGILSTGDFKIFDDTAVVRYNIY